jgi:hypothetical protein
MEYPDIVQEKLDEFIDYIDDDSDELSHIADATLKLIYGAIMWDPDGVLEVGEALLDTSTDSLALMEAMLEAVKKIEGDIEEHPNHGSPVETKSKIIELNNKIEQLKAEGKQSTIFTEYEKKR